MRKIISAVALCTALAGLKAYAQGEVSMNSMQSGGYVLFTNAVAGTRATNDVLVGLYWGTSPTTVTNVVNSGMGSPAGLARPSGPGDVSNPLQYAFVTTASQGGSRYVGYPGQTLYFQLKAWSAGFSSWEAAKANATPLTLVSSPSGPVVARMSTSSSLEAPPTIPWGGTSGNPIMVPLVTVYSLNVPPVLAPVGNRLVNEGALLSFTAMATDDGIGSQPLSFSLDPGAPAGASISPQGLFTWQPTEAQGGGSYSVTVRVSDGISSASETIQITVNEVNLPPVLGAIGNRNVNEESLLTFAATATDPDLPAQSLVFSLDAGAPAGAGITPGGLFTWTPTEAQGPGSFPVTVRVSDGVTSASETIQIAVIEVNVPPVLATIGDKSVNEGTLLTFSATATDADQPTNTLVFSLDTGAPAGASITSGGVFTWTPSEAQGPATNPVTVRVSDGATSASETIQIVVNEVNVAPVVGPIASLTNTDLSPITFTATATDADQPTNTLSFSLDSGAPPAATLSANGVFSWTPTESDRPSTNDITVRVTDDGSPSLSGTRTFAVVIRPANTAPVLDSLLDLTNHELTLITFAATATDAETDTNALVFTLGDGAPSGASISTNGVFTWTPAEAQGPSTNTVKVIVTDNGVPPLSATNSFTIVVNEVNVVPALAAIGNKTVNEGSPLAFAVTATDTDVPAQSLTFSLATGAPTGASITAGGAFTWTPTEAQGPGTYPVTVVVSDGVSTSTETIQITVNEVNVAPALATIGNKTVNEGSLLSFTATATDTDVPAQTLTFSLATGAPTGSSITAGGAFTWRPTETQGPGTYPVTVVVSDGVTNSSETIQITVDEVNVVPALATIGNKTGNEGELLAFTATATDTDVPAQTLTFSLATGAPTGASITAGGAFAWTPTEAQGPGTYPVTVVVSDGVTNSSETIQIMVNEVNEAPALAAIGNKTVNEGSPLTFTATATDGDVPAQTLTFSLATGASTGASITAGGGFTWTPTEAQGPGTFPVTVVVSDGVTNSTETIQITVNEVNAAPALATIGNKTVNEGELLAFTATPTDTDVPAQTLTFSLATGAPTGASITAGGGFTWTPTEAQGPGTSPVTVVVSDGVTNSSETIQITVNEVNVAPALATIGNKTVNEGSPLTFTATATDGDAPAQTLTFSLVTGAPTGASITSSGVFTWTPTEVQGSSTNTVTVRVSDGVTSTSETIQITVNEVNEAPALAAIGNQLVDENDLLTFTATATDADWPTNHLTFSLDAGAPTGALITSDGVFTWTPSSDQGPTNITITVRVTDNGTPSLSATCIVEVVVGEVTQVAGVGQDGYVADADVFFDTNRNGIRDPGEPATTTDDKGEFVLYVPLSQFDTNHNGKLDSFEGCLVLTGGRDIATGQTLKMAMTAPAGSTVVNPLTTVLQEILEQSPELSLSNAQQQVRSALRLTNEIDLTTYDPIKNALSNDLSASAVLSAAAQVQDTTVQITALVDGATTNLSTADVGRLVTASLAAQIQSGGQLTLSVPTEVIAVLTQVVEAAGATLGSNVAQGAAQIIAGGNELKAEVAASSANGLEAAEEISRIQGITQGAVATELALVASNIVVIDDAVAGNTGSNFESQVESAPVGDVTGTETRPGTFAFSEAVASVLENGVAISAVTLVRTDGNQGAVGVRLTPSNGSATSQAGDFTSVPIDLQFADGEISKTVNMAAVVTDDAVVETEENLHLTLTLLAGAPVGAAVGALNQTLVTVVDNDTPGTFLFTGSQYSVREDGSVVDAITITRTGGSSGTVNLVVTPAPVAVGATPTLDYNPAPITVTFPPGNMNRVVTIPVVMDTLWNEGDETLTLNLTLAAGNPPGTQLGAQRTATLTIINCVVNLAALAPVTTGEFRFKLTGTPGQWSKVQQSSDLVNWTDLSTHQLGTTPVTVTGPRPQDASKRFYRAVLLR